MTMEYPFISIQDRWFLIGMVAYSIITILTLIVYYKKIPSTFHKIKEMIIQKKCFGKLVIYLVAIAAIACIRISRLPKVYDMMDSVCEVLVRMDLLCIVFYFYILYRQKSYKNKKATQPVLEAFLFITLVEMFICLWWRGTDKIVFKFTYIPNIICLLILFFYAFQCKLF